MAGQPRRPQPLWLTAAQELRSNARMRTVYDHLAAVLPPMLAVSPAGDDPVFDMPPLPRARAA